MSITTAACSSSAGLSSSGYPRALVSRYLLHLLLLYFSIYLRTAFVPALMNSFVHIIMYGYYSLSALGPRLYPYLWWKRYLTVLQLLQFAFGLAWGTQAIVNRCEYQPWLSYTGVAYMLSFLFLFGRFYVQRYTKVSAVKTTGEKCVKYVQ